MLFAISRAYPDAAGILVAEGDLQRRLLLVGLDHRGPVVEQQGGRLGKVQRASLVQGAAPVLYSLHFTLMTSREGAPSRWHDVINIVRGLRRAWLVLYRIAACSVREKKQALIIIRRRNVCR